MAEQILIVTGFTLVLTELLKKTFNVPTRFIPLSAVAVAIFVGGVGGFTGILTLSPIEAIIASLTASGLWSGGRATIGK